VTSGPAEDGATAAVRLLSGHPWYVRPVDHGFEIRADHTRGARSTGLGARTVRLAVGAALFNIRLAVAVFGHQSVVSWSLDGPRSYVVAVVRQGVRRDPTPVERALFAAIAAHQHLPRRRSKGKSDAGDSPRRPHHCGADAADLFSRSGSSLAAAYVVAVRRGAPMAMTANQIIHTRFRTQVSTIRESAETGRLADVHSRPDPARGVFGEHRGMVIGDPVGVELGDHDVQDLSREQQRGRQAQRQAIECSLVRDPAPWMPSRRTTDTRFHGSEPLGHEQIDGPAERVEALTEASAACRATRLSSTATAVRTDLISLASFVLFAVAATVAAWWPPAGRSGGTGVAADTQ
jgi:hypothetical protein